MKKDFAIALVLVVAGVAVTTACSSSSKKDPKSDGGSGTGGAGGVGGGTGAGGTGGATPDGGGRGGSSGASGSTGTGGAGGDCAGDLEACETNGDCCGFAAGENVCVDTQDPTLGTACLISCTANTECQSNCCAQLEGGGGVCGPADLCADCAADLEPCTTNADCCGFAMGDNVCVDTGTGGIGVACLIVCTANTECQSNCCTALEAGAARVCAPASACTAN